MEAKSRRRKRQRRGEIKMGKMSREDAERAAKQIGNDIKSRKGIGDQWENLDEDIKSAIIDSWTDKIWNEMTRGAL